MYTLPQSTGVYMYTLPVSEPIPTSPNFLVFKTQNSPVCQHTEQQSTLTVSVCHISLTSLFTVGVCHITLTDSDRQY